MRVLVVLPVHEATDDVVAFERALRSSAPAAELWRGPADAGFASACSSGFHRAVAGGYDVVITMDADGTHDPGVISTMVGRIVEGADVVIGSRYVRGGGVGGRPWWAHVGSRAANVAIGVALRLGARDSTSRFRAYRSSAVAAVDGPRLPAPAFSIELLRRLRRSGHHIAEVPIVHRRRATTR